MSSVAVDIFREALQEKRECRQGHALTSKTTYKTPKGYIHCKVCLSIADREFRDKNRAAGRMLTELAAV